MFANRDASCIFFPSDLSIVDATPMPHDCSSFPGHRYLNLKDTWARDAPTVTWLLCWLYGWGANYVPTYFSLTR